VPTKNGQKVRLSRSGAELVNINLWILKTVDERYRKAAAKADKSKSKLQIETLIENKP